MPLATHLRRLLHLVAAVALGYWGLVTVYAYVTNASASRALDELIRRRDDDTRALSAAKRSLKDGALLGRVDAPRVGVSTVVLEGTTPRWLAVAAGHVRGTALPGDDGNVVIAGHRDSFFRGLRKVKVGDVISLTAPAAERHYVVESLAIVDPTDAWVMRDDGRSKLTLVTCYPFGYIGRAPQRFVVTAGLRGDRSASAAGRPSARVAAGTSLTPRAAGRSLTTD